MFHEDNTCSMTWGQLEKEKGPVSQEQSSTCRGVEATEGVASGRGRRGAACPTRSRETGGSLVLKPRLGSGMVQSSSLEDPSAYPLEAYLLL